MDDASAAIEEAAATLSAATTDIWEDLLVDLLACVAVLLIGFVIYRIIMFPVRKLLVENDNTRRGGTIFRNIVRAAVAIWVVACILDILFDVDIAGVLGALGIVGVAVSLGAQQTIANLIGGIIISLSETIAPGDWVVVGNANKEAEVIETGWRLTTLVDEDGVRYLVPNSKMVSEIVTSKRRFYTIVVPFSLAPSTTDVEALLVECEEALLARQREHGIDFEGMRPKAHVSGVSLGAIDAEVKLYVDRSIDTRAAERAIMPALIDLLQEHDDLPNSLALVTAE